MTSGLRVNERISKRPADDLSHTDPAVKYKLAGEMPALAQRVTTVEQPSVTAKLRRDGEATFAFFCSATICDIVDCRPCASSACVKCLSRKLDSQSIPRFASSKKKQCSESVIPRMRA